ncbi:MULTISPECIES: tryptophan--tRNA ligase [Halorubrum]|uniref:Tryptophan--tRNA ligase n=1 Tax=Halorubrum hochstenium ATCC 700873 TaxID=1227481 RepID=M0F7J1_9EURY|nr:MULTISPECIES: tryptophan--tRNA ligase [Halorubrum]ELZ55925.1 tryptophanyl-tRNA ligase [Halorubrum hochstenium ATCC 700873]
MDEDTPEGAAPGDRGAALADGGTERADEPTEDVALDPWGSASVGDYADLFEEFGIEAFDDVADGVPDPHYLMRRGVIFGHREYDAVAEAMANDEPFAALSGFMPTGDPHIGHKLVFDEIIWHQEQGGDAFGLIADLEAHSARGMSWGEIDEHARNYLLSLLALGFDADEGEIYRQSDNRAVQDLGFELGSKANFSEFEAIYGFDGETNISHMQSVVTQTADILYPQLVDEPKPTVIPVGPDQDPHVRLTRDLATRVRYFKVTEAFASFELDDDERQLVRAAYDALAADDAAGGTDGDGEGETDVRCEDAAEWLADYEPPESDRESVDLAAAKASALDKLEAGGKEPLRPRVRFFDRNATDEAFEALIEAVEGEKRVFEGHVDAFNLTRDEAESVAREVEIDHDGFGFRQPSSIYHRFMTGLTGGKMSSSIPASHISLLDDPEDGYDKVKAATTGGRDTAEEQRELGGEADECPVYELYAYLLAGDDDELTKEVYSECVNGERLCGGCKEQAAELMREFLEDHQEKRAEAEELLADLDIDLDSDRRGTGGEH